MFAVRINKDWILSLKSTREFSILFFVCLRPIRLKSKIHNRFFVLIIVHNESPKNFIPVLWIWSAVLIFVFTLTVHAFGKQVNSLLCIVFNFGRRHKLFIATTRRGSFRLFRHKKCACCLPSRMSNNQWKSDLFLVEVNTWSENVC